LKYSFESNRRIGGVGAALLAIGAFLPILIPVGIALLVISLWGFSEYYDERAIYRNARRAVIVGLIGILVILISFLVLMALLAGSVIPQSSAYAVGYLVGYLGMGPLLIAVYFLILIFISRSFNILSTRTGEKMFKTAGYLVILGIVLTLFSIGAVVLLIAWIIVAAAFFSIRPARQLPPPPPPLPS